MIVSGQIRSILPSFRKNTPIFPGQSFGHPARAPGKGVEGCQEWVSGKGVRNGYLGRAPGKGVRFGNLARARSEGVGGMEGMTNKVISFFFIYDDSGGRVSLAWFRRNKFRLHPSHDYVAGPSRSRGHGRPRHPNLPYHHCRHIHINTKEGD